MSRENFSWNLLAEQLLFYALDNTASKDLEGKKGSKDVFMCLDFKEKTMELVQNEVPIKIVKLRDCMGMRKDPNNPYALSVFLTGKTLDLVMYSEEDRNDGCVLMEHVAQSEATDFGSGMLCIHKGTAQKQASDVSYMMCSSKCRCI